MAAVRDQVKPDTADGNGAMPGISVITQEDRVRLLRWPATVDGLAVERVVERQPAKFQCNQRFRCDPPCHLCRSCYRCEEAGPS